MILLLTMAAMGSPIFMTGNQLYDLCMVADTASCLRYVEGASDLYASFDQASQARTACVPENVTLGQEKDIVVAYLRDDPKDRNLPGAILVLGAIARAFPCGK